MRIFDTSTYRTMATTCATIDIHALRETDENLERITVVWLDIQTNDLPENVTSQQTLLTVINHLEKFCDIEKCKDYIEHVSENEHIVVVASGRLGEQLVPSIHDLQQVLSIYIFCLDKERHDRWAKDFSKVKGVFVHSNELINKIKTDYQRQNNKQNDELLMNIFNMRQSPGQSTSSLNHQSVHQQIFIDCLLRLKSASTDKDELISRSLQQYEGKPQTRFIREFQANYTPDRACFWYTKGSFLHQELNKALRVSNIDMLFYFRFFIRDIREQLESHRCTTAIRVYRAQLISKEEVCQLEDSIGGFISVNSFLSTSRDRELALFLLGDYSNVQDDFQRVLFEIDADPSLDGVKVFADISSFSHFVDESEVLFMLGSVFRLMDIRREDNGLYIIYMISSSDREHDFKFRIDQMKKHYSIGETSLLSIGQVLHQMGRLNDAIKYYRRLLNELPRDDDEIALCYHNLGRVFAVKQEYDSSLSWYDKALDTMRKTFDRNDNRIAACHNSIANVHRKSGDHGQALESYQNALIIWRRTHGGDSLKAAMCLINMGVVHYAKEDYPKALECLEKALEIMKRYRRGNNRDLAALYNNLGLVYDSMGNFHSALSSYQQAYDTYQKSFNPKDVDVASTLENIGRLYENHHQQDKAIKYLKAAVKKYRLNLSSSDPRVVRIEEDIRQISFQSD